MHDLMREEDRKINKGLVPQRWIENQQLTKEKKSLLHGT